MVLKGYFDGGNQPDSTRYDRVTLAAACGTNDQWCALESAWKEVLAKHKAPPLHTTDAIGLHAEFSAEKGWDHNRVDNFVSDCVGVVEKHMVLPGELIIPEGPGWRKSIARDGVNIFTFTIPIADYKRARQVVPMLPTSCTEICVSETLGLVFSWGRRIGAGFYELYFDQNEPFYGHVQDRRVNKKSKKQVTLLEKVAYVGESDSRLVPALQIADLFAWCINHVGDVRRKWHRRLNDLPWDSLILDYGLLLGPIPGALERTAAWNLPKRKLDR